MSNPITNHNPQEFHGGFTIKWGFPDGSTVKNPPANSGNTGSIPGSGRSPGKGNGNPLQYSCMRNPMDREAWWATVYGVSKQVRYNLATNTKVIQLNAATAKLLQSCPTSYDPIDSSLPGSPVSVILQARTLEWVAISFSNAWKWKVKVKSLSRVRLLATPWSAAHQAPPSMGFSR